MSDYSNQHNVDDEGVAGLLGKTAIPFARVALGVTYIWFGALKVVGKSPVEDMVAKTASFLPKKVVVPLMGLWEISVGVGFLFRLALPTTMVLFVLQLAGTFMVLVRHPEEAFKNGNPLLLTERGEFIIKNLVLLAAGLAVGSTARRESEEIPASSGRPAH